MMELRTFKQRLRDLSDDHESGAIYLALKALGIGIDWIAEGRLPEDLAAELEAMHPAIATVANVGAALRDRDPGLPARLAELRDSLIEGNRRIAGKLGRMIPSSASVITISNSSTVRESLVEDWSRQRICAPLSTRRRRQRNGGIASNRLRGTTPGNPSGNEQHRSSRP